MLKSNCESQNTQKECLSLGLENCQWKPAFSGVKSIGNKNIQTAPLDKGATSNEGVCKKVLKRNWMNEWYQAKRARGLNHQPGWKSKEFGDDQTSSITQYEMNELKEKEKRRALDLDSHKDPYGTGKRGEATKGSAIKRFNLSTDHERRRELLENMNKLKGKVDPIKVIKQDNQSSIQTIKGTTTLTNYSSGGLTSWNPREVPKLAHVSKQEHIAKNKNGGQREKKNRTRKR